MSRQSVAGSLTRTFLTGSLDTIGDQFRDVVPDSADRKRRRGPLPDLAPPIIRYPPGSPRPFVVRWRYLSPFCLRPWPHWPTGIVVSPAPAMARSVVCELWTAAVVATTAAQARELVMISHESPVLDDDEIDWHATSEQPVGWSPWEAPPPGSQCDLRGLGRHEWMKWPGVQ